MMKQALVVTLIILISASFAAAELEFQGVKSVYNLGDRLKASIKLTAEEDVDGLISANLECEGYKLEYFRAPLQVSSGEEQTIELTGIKIIEDMIGNCHLFSEIKQIEGDFIENDESAEFSISNELELSIEADNTEIIPGQAFLLSGSISPSYETFAGASLRISLMDEIKLTQRNFSVPITVPENMSAGKTNINVDIEDYHKNSARGTITIDVKQVPTFLEVSTDREAIKPGEPIRYDINLYDQAGDSIKETAEVEITDAGGKKIFEDKIETIQANRIELARYAMPGNYIIKAKIGLLEGSASFEVEKVNEIEMNLEGQSVLVTNVGNTDYDKTIEVQLNKEDKNYVVLKKVNLKPGETQIIELSKEVPEGAYDVVLPIKDGGNEGLAAETAEEDTALISGVEIDDERSTLTKAAQGLSGITGAASINTSATGSKILLILPVIAIIGALITLVSNRRLRQEVVTVVQEKIKKENKKRGVLKTALKQMGAKKSRLEESFSKHVDPSVVREIIQKPETKVQGESREITALFTDIRGFTCLSEKEDPWFVVNLLNMYFEAMSGIVRKNKGMIDKFIGDSLMALYNAPFQQENHLISAVSSAIEMREELKKLNHKLEQKGKKPIDMGIGINSGKAIIGNIGSATKMEYTAIGNTVNLARRLQEQGKGSQILITEETYKMIQDKVVAEKVQAMHLKHIEKPVNVYNVTGFRI